MFTVRMEIGIIAVFWKTLKNIQWVLKTSDFYTFSSIKAVKMVRVPVKYMCKYNTENDF